MEQGDIVFVFDGAQTPFLLRKVGVCVSEDPDSEGRRKQLSLFQVVGECYLHGFMDGEVMAEEYDAAQEFVVVL